MATVQIDQRIFNFRYKKASQDHVKHACLQIDEVVESVFERKIHFHKLVKSPEYTVAGLNSRNIKITHQLHFHPHRNPSDPSDMSGSNKLDAWTIGNSCANCNELCSCSKASGVHAMNSASQSGKACKGGEIR